MKRATTIADARITLERQYKKELQRKCCVDGMRDTPLSYDCQRRSEYIDLDQECIDAFLDCCRNLTILRADRKQEFDLINARSYSDDDDFNMDMDEVVTRTKFPESWLFEVVTIPECSPKGTCLQQYTKSIGLPDSITSWQLTGISLSKSHGICVSEPLEIIARKPFFIDLRLPYSAVRGEQLEIKAILHNLMGKKITVRLELLETPHVCSMASKKTKYRLPDFPIGAKSTRAVPLVIIPMKTGMHDIQVRGIVKGQFAGDGIKKKLRVVDAGELKKIKVTIPLEPSKHNGTQHVSVRNRIPRREMAPGTHTETQILVTGGAQMSTLVENALSGKSMESLIYMPSGCAEQNIGRMAFPVIATTYLDTILKWEDVGGLSKRSEALQYISTGYTQQLTYRQPSENCFSLFPTNKCGSNSQCCRVRLTAYIVKVFAMASNLVTVDNGVLCGAVTWLTRQQKDTGEFEDNRSSFGLNTETSVTAFTIIALLEAQKVCPQITVQSNIDRGVSYLEGKLQGLETTYAVAITSYALALYHRNKFNKDVLLRKAQGGNHWSVNNGQSYTFEATGYALLALVKAQCFEEAKPVVKWLNQQRTPTESYSNSQATMVVYQALAEYWTSADVKVNELDVDLNVEISVAGRQRSNTYNFNKDNIYTTRKEKVKDENVSVTANGTGEATLTVVSFYYALPTEQKDHCEMFNLSVKLIPEKVGGGGGDDDLDVYKLKIEVKYKGDKDATMTILDIRLPTGYMADNKDLDKLSTGVDRSISKYEIDKTLSDKGSIIIYFDKVSHNQTEEVAFRIEREFKVALLQPAAVSVYEYNNEKPCVKFYRPERTHGELLQLCQGNLCACAEENCSKQQKERLRDEERKTIACSIEEKDRVDYVYKVRVENITEEPTVHIYQMRIMQVLKEGTDKGADKGVSTFIGVPGCKKSLGLDKDKTFLIMGRDNDVHIDHGSYYYVLGEKTWIEYWPNPEECQGEEYRPVCLGMQYLVNQLDIFGCLN